MKDDILITVVDWTSVTEELIKSLSSVIVRAEVRGDPSSIVKVSSGPNIFVLTTYKVKSIVSSIRFGVEVVICSKGLIMLAWTSKDSVWTTESWLVSIEEIAMKSTGYSVGGDMISWNSKVIVEAELGKLVKVTSVYEDCLMIVQAGLQELPELKILVVVILSIDLIQNFWKLIWICIFGYQTDGWIVMVKLQRVETVEGENWAVVPWKGIVVNCKLVYA